MRRSDREITDMDRIMEIVRKQNVCCVAFQDTPCPYLIMDFSLLSPLEFFADPKNGDGRNNQPPAMRVRVDCYTKKLPFRLQ